MQYLNPMKMCVCVSVLEISVFCMVSKEIAGHIVDYISSLAWKNKMIIESFHRSTCLEQRSTIRHYRDLSKQQFKFIDFILCSSSLDCFCHIYIISISNSLLICGRVINDSLSQHLTYMITIEYRKSRIEKNLSCFNLILCFCVHCLRFAVQEVYPVATDKGQVKVYLQQVFTGKKGRGESTDKNKILQCIKCSMNQNRINKINQLTIYTIFFS